MPYVTDGSVHHAGVKNEHLVAQQFNQHPPQVIVDAYPDMKLVFEQLGGTRSVKDINIMCDGTCIAGVSVKLHSSSGTFDYINTSKVTDYIPQAAATIASLRAVRTEFLGRSGSLSEVRTRVKTQIATLWDNLENNAIRGLLRSIHERNPTFIAVVSRTGTLTVSHERLLELSVHPYDADVVYELRNTRAVSSRQIWRTKNGKGTNTNLRVRLTLNNGVGALIGLSEKNKSSILSLKIQQDNVNELLTSLA